MAILSKISGTGSYLPKKILTNDALSKMVDTGDEWIFQRVGIKQRHIADDSEVTSDLAANAAREALMNAHVDAADIDLIIVATITPDKLLPSTATQVQKKINAQNAAAIDINAACSGFVYGLTIADQFIKSGFYKNIIIIGVEILSRFMNWNDRNTCVLFGDGAGAVVLSLNHSGNGAGIKYGTLGADGFTPPEWLEIPAGGSALPASKQTVEQNLHYYLNLGLFVSDPFSGLGMSAEAGIGIRLFEEDDLSLMGRYVDSQGGVNSIATKALELRYSIRFD